MIDANDIYEKLTKAGNDWAVKNGNADLLEEGKKVILAELGRNVDSSYAAKEAYALASPEYKEHVEKMVKARTEANKAKVEYESRKAWVDIMRTNAATERVANRSAV